MMYTKTHLVLMRRTKIMLRLLQFLFIGHIHKWETVETRRLENAAGATGTRVHLKCQHCGIWDYQDLI